MTEEGIGGELNVRRIQHGFAGFKMQGPYARFTENLLKAKGSSWLTASKGARASVLICKKLNSAYNPNELVRSLFPESSDNSPDGQHLDF